MPRGRPLAVLTLEEGDRETLTRWTRRPKTAQALAQRARIVLAAADGRANDAIARDLSITAPYGRQVAPTLPGAAAPTDCSTSRGRAPRARSATSRSRRSS